MSKSKYNNSDNALKISASYENKVIQQAVDNINNLKIGLEAFKIDDKNESDAVQENQQAEIERTEVQTRVDKLEEDIFNAIFELDRLEKMITSINEERQVVENNINEVNLSS